MRAQVWRTMRGVRSPALIQPLIDSLQLDADSEVAWKGGGDTCSETLPAMRAPARRSEAATVQRFQSTGPGARATRPH